MQGPFYKCLNLLKRVPQEGLKISGDPREEKGLQYWLVSNEWDLCKKSKDFEIMPRQNQQEKELQPSLGV
jgi:hypothetical protein